MSSGAFGATRLLVTALALAASVSLWAAKPAKQPVVPDGPYAVSKVVDGDTVWLVVPGQPAPYKARIEGIDAPEICQPGGQAAQKAMQQWVQTPPLVHWKSHDVYGRWLVRLATPHGSDIGEQMVAAGHAWSYRYKGAKGVYDSIEAQARQARKGVFADPQVMNPYDFRRKVGSCYKQAR
jgi:endonuclease YncB( thermonuclease family)